MARALRVVLAALSSVALLALGLLALTRAHLDGPVRNGFARSVYSHDVVLKDARRPEPAFS